MGDAVATDITIDVKPAPVGGGNIAWYRFDEENGATVLDSSGNVNDAVIIGGIADRVEGIFGNALQLRSTKP